MNKKLRFVLPEAQDLFLFFLYQSHISTPENLNLRIKPTPFNSTWHNRENNSKIIIMMNKKQNKLDIHNWQNNKNNDKNNENFPELKWYYFWDCV